MEKKEGAVEEVVYILMPQLAQDPTRNDTPQPIQPLDAYEALYPPLQSALI
jgi:hypothetical protein